MRTSKYCNERKFKRSAGGILPRPVSLVTRPFLSRQGTEVNKNSTSYSSGVSPQKKKKKKKKKETEKKRKIKKGSGARHEDVEIDVQSTGHFCCLSQLDGHPFAGILYAAATAMKLVIIGCPEVEPLSILACVVFCKTDFCQGQVFRHHGDIGCRFLPGDAANNFLASSNI